MPRKKPIVEGKRVNIWIPPAQIERAEEIENLSRFFQLCLDNAADIMAWAILRSVEPKKYHPTHEFDAIIDEFNEKYPLDPLTQKRQGKWPTHSPKLPDVLS